MLKYSEECHYVCNSLLSGPENKNTCIFYKSFKKKFLNLFYSKGPSLKYSTKYQI